MFSRFRGLLCLGLLSLVLASAVFWASGGTDSWNICLLALGLTTWIYAARSSRAELAPPLDRWLGWMVVLFPGYVALQLVPLPLFVLQRISPARAALTEALAHLGPVPFTPLSIHPGATGAHLVRILAYTLIFLLVRELSVHLWPQPWLPALPIIAVAGLEGALGTIQYFSDPRHATAQGTYLNRNHYAALLEMAPPLAILCAWALLGRERGDEGREGRSRSSYALPAGLLLLAAGLTLAGIIYSLSRMPFALALGALFVIAVFASGVELPGRKKGLAALALALLFLGSVFLLAPDRLVERFADIPNQISDDARWVWWGETLHLIADYPLAGSGLGTYDSAYPKYQTTALDPTSGLQGYQQAFAHNDSLQLMAELGLVGFFIPALGMLLILMQAVRAARSGIDRDVRFRGLAAALSITVILIHSLVEFNVYVPANALVLAWIAGIAASLPSASVRIGSPRKILMPAWFHKFALALGALLIVSASLWLAPAGYFEKNPRVERALCWLGMDR